ncbi:hypothetical protein Pmar_PMAR003879, partial [Perkinsus marinus ATCC 50983]
MWASTKLLCLYAFSAAGDADTYTGHSLQIYKQVRYPWYIKEHPYCCNESIPHYQNYTWDSYFDYLISSGANLQLGGYKIRETSKIGVDFYGPWSRTGFKALRERADAAGKVIIAELDTFLKGTFDKASFIKSVKEFRKDYPVDGFNVGFRHSDPSRYQVGKELVAAIKELNLRVSLGLTKDDYHAQEFKQTGIGKMVDSVAVFATPRDTDESIENFNTGRFAEDMIKDVVEAGVDRNKQILF